MTHQKLNMVRAQLMGALPDLLRETGGEKAVRIAFERQELPLDLCRTPGQWLPMPDMLGLFEQAARYTGDPIFSLRVARATDMAGYGAPGAYLSASRTFVEFCHRLGAVLGLMQTGTVYDLRATGDTGAMTLEWPSPTRIGRIHMGIRFVIIVRQALLRYFGADAEIHWLALETGDTRVRDRLEDELGVPVHIDQPYHGIHFPGRYLARGPETGLDGAAWAPVTSIDQVRAAYDTPVPDEEVAAVREVVKLRLLGGQTDLDGTARRLRVSPRTLQRLLEGGTHSYRDIVQDALMERARSLLSDTELSVRDISEVLGYSEPSHFIRSFRRRFGLSPGASRRAGRADVPPP